MWRVWIRELTAGILIVAGLVSAGFCIRFLDGMLIIEGGMLVVLTFILIGAGSHLLKVALAVDVLMGERRAGSTSK